MQKNSDKQYNHKLGTYWANDKEPFAFINIPKCASTSMKQVLKKADYTQRQGYTDKECFALIRDPYTRYKSGVYQYWQNKADGDFEQWSMKQKHPQIFDEHTVPQSAYIKEFERVNVEPMRRINYVANLLAGNNTSHFNMSPASRYHVVDEGKIREFYKEDYELWDALA